MSRSRSRGASPALLLATVALFVALGGGAYAGVSLNEVRSANIKNGEVKTVDLADAAVSGAKLKEGAASPHLLVAESDPEVDLEDCGGDLLDCPNLLTLALNTPVDPAPGGAPVPANEIPKRDWLVQAKIVVIGQDIPDDERNNCGLVIDGSTVRSGVLDSAASRLSREFTPGEFETVALSAAVRKRLKNPRIGLRCTSLQFQDSEVSDMKITALEVQDITQAG